MTTASKTCQQHCLSTFLLWIAVSRTQSVTGWCPPFPRSTVFQPSIRCGTNSHILGSSRRRRDVYEYDDYENDAYYWEDKPERLENSWDDAPNRGDGPGAYNVYFGGSSYDEDEDVINWELCDDGSTWVLLPPTYVSVPTAVIHFVGGTFFGSAPKTWYRTLLEGIVRATKCTVVATAVPVTLLQNPLRHVSLSRKLQRQFQNAWVNVLSDEYDVDALSAVPVVGMGHSLGSRLLTVLATLSDFKMKPVMVPPYKSYILVSFNNYGASASVPGIQALLKQSQSVQYDTKERQRRSRRRRQKRRDYEYDDYDEDDEDYDEEDWEEVLEEIQDAIKEQAAKVKSALTPRSEELEFHPTPAQLWEALKDDKRYKIPQTLVVQFDDDEVDQSPRLADCLVKTESSDVKYAWLRGNHLTPISAEGERGWSKWLRLPSEASKALSQIVRGSSKRRTSDAMRDLRQSIARYITDVVTK